MHKNILKQYLSNLLTGVVFWYGIEKLFMRHIGISAGGIGFLTAMSLAIALLLDVPAGMVADKWSRKGMLMFAMIFMITSSLILGTSHGLFSYSIGYVFYSLYVVCTNGVYQAIMYDTLHELGQAGSYSKINGRAYALFLAGASIANLASGFLAHKLGFRATFYLSILPCLVNLLVILSMHEPKFHKEALETKTFGRLKRASYEILKVRLLFGLAVVESGLTIVEVFKSDFGQLYMLRYFSEPQILGLLWAAYALTWSLGSLIAHKLHTRLNWLILMSVVPLVIMSVWDSRWSLVFFMLQAVVAAALFNQIETRIQDATPSDVRASVFSLISSVGRLIAIPASIIIGLIIRSSNILAALRFTTLIGVAILIFWIFIVRGVSRKSL